MFKNYLTVAWRNLLKHKGFTAINIVGLSLSMSVCLVIISLIYDHFQYDNFHPDGKNTYRIITNNEGQTGIGDLFATSPLPFGEALAVDYPFVKSYTNLANAGRMGELTSTHKVLEAQSWFADKNFFEVFGFELIEGNSASALKHPYSIVLTKEIAEKLFPNNDGMGQMIEFTDHGSYMVTGIVDTPPSKSHIQFEALLSISTTESLIEKNILGNITSWSHVWSCYNYMIFHEGTDIQNVEAAITKLATQNIVYEDEDDAKFEFSLQNIEDVVPGKLMSNEIGFALPAIILVFFGLLGVIVLVTASINYTNLSIAKSISRAKEIGIRKSNGARKDQIIWQFLVESVFISLLSLGGAVVIYKFLVVKFNELWIFNLVGVELVDSWMSYGYFLGFSLVLGFFTGIAPALFLSKIDVISSLKGSIVKVRTRRGLSKYFSGKKLLTGIQFGFSIILLVSIFLIRDQGNHLVEGDYGFDENNIYFVELQGHDPDLVAAEFSSIAGVENVSFTSHHPAIGRSHGTGVKKSMDQEESITVLHFSVDQEYVDLMDLELIAGDDFPKEMSTENEKFVLLNEKAVKRLDLGSPEDAVGEILIFDDSTQMTVVGVLKDYHWEPLMQPIKPLALRVVPEDYQLAYFKIAGNSPLKTTDAFSEKWQNFDESRELKAGFLDEKLDQFYQFFFDLGGILSLVGILAIVITSLGFLGMISFELKSKTKEIGIRKVLGADFMHLAVILTKSFLVMLLFSVLIAVPIAVFINGLWVYEMASHQPISLLNVGPAVMIIVLLSIAMIAGLLIKNVTQNPVKSLRYE